MQDLRKGNASYTNITQKREQQRSDITDQVTALQCFGSLQRPRNVVGKAFGSEWKGCAFESWSAAAWFVGRPSLTSFQGR